LFPNPEIGRLLKNSPFMLNCLHPLTIGETSCWLSFVGRLSRSLAHPHLVKKVLEKKPPCPTMKGQKGRREMSI
jgi:hypothetical protein